MTVQTEQARSGHPFRMWDAIMETPDFVERCLQPDLAEPAKKVGREIVERGINRVFLLGCGSSFYAASSAARAFQTLAGLDADAYDSFEFHKYRLGFVTPKTAVISFSHSGATRETVDVAREVRKRGAFTVSVTDRPESLLADSADFFVNVGGGREPVEPKTRSVVSTFVMGYLMAIGALPKERQDQLDEELKRIPAALRSAQGLEARAKELAEKYSGVKRVLAVGNGQNYVTAMEIALKFKEAVLLAGEGLETEEAFHGPIASLNDSTLVIATSCPGPSYQKTKDYCVATSMIGCRVLSVSPEPYDLPGVDKLEVPMDGISEVFSNSVLVYPQYMLAYYSALVRGNMPDAFRIGDKAFHAAMAAVPPLTY